MRYIPPHLSLLLSLLCQIVGFSAGALLLAIGVAPPGYHLLGHAAAAALLAQYLGLPLPWLLLNAALPLAAPLLLGAEVRPSWWLAIAVLMLLFAPTFWTKVPFYPTNRALYRLVLEQLPADKPFSFLDAGCGFSSLLFYLARRRPQGSYLGAELNPLPYAAAKLRALFHPRVTVRFTDLWRLPFAGFDYVYAFLAPPPMPDLWRKAQREMGSDSTLLINSFPVPADASLVLETTKGGQTLYIYRMKGRRETSF